MLKVVAIGFAVIIAALLGVFLSASPAQGPSASPAGNNGSNGSTPASSGASGITGDVSLGPTCPVERIPPDPACAPRPYATDVSVFAGNGHAPYRIVHTDAAGKFTVPLPPGIYRVHPAGGNPLPRCEEAEVTVAANAMQAVHMSCDTGIR